MNHFDDTGGAWRAWLYNFSSNTLALVRLDRTTETYTLPLPEDIYPYSNPVFSSDGALLAFCQTDSQGNASVRVHDIFAGADLMDYSLGVIAGCSVGPAAFSEDKTQLAFGVLNYYPPDPQADPEKPAWELLVADLASGEIAHRFDSNAPALAGLGLRANLTQMGFMPMVRYFHAGQIAFALMPWATEGTAEADGLLWQLGDGSVSALDLYGKLSMDTLDETGEVIWLDADESLPMPEPFPALGPLFNVVMYANKTGERRAIFTQTTAPVQARFIDEGRRVAVQMVGAFDEQTGTAPTQWAMLDRAGAVEMLPSELSDHNLVNAPEGFAILHTEYRGADFTDPLTELRYYRIVDSGGGLALEGTVLWDDPTDAWMIAWSPAIVVPETLAPFPPIDQ